MYTHCHSRDRPFILRGCLLRILFMVVGRFAFTERGQMRKQGTRTSPESVGSRGGTSTGHGGGSSNMGWAHVNGSRSLHHRRLRRKPSRSSTEPRSAPLRRNRRTPTYGLTVRESPRRSAVSVRETPAMYPLLPTTMLPRPSPFARNLRTFAPHQSKRFSFFRSFSTFGSPFSNPHVQPTREETTKLTDCPFTPPVPPPYADSCTTTITTTTVTITATATDISLDSLETCPRTGSIRTKHPPGLDFLFVSTDSRFIQPCVVNDLAPVVRG